MKTLKTINSRTKAGAAFVLALSVLSLGACNSRATQEAAIKKLDRNASAMETVSFSKDVMPLIQTKCNNDGCHGVNNPKKIQLITYNFVRAEVKPERPASSKIIDRITRTGVGKMPLNGHMTEQEKTTIYAWVKQGAKDN